MINNNEYIRYNHIDKNLLKIVKITWFKSKGRLQRTKLTITLKINNIDITDKLRKAIFENNFIIKLIKQLKIRLIENFIIIKNLLTF